MGWRAEGSPVLGFRGRSAGSGRWGLQPSAPGALAGKSRLRAPRQPASGGSSPRPPDREKGPARESALSPRSSSPSPNWPLSLIRSCRSSAGCGCSRAEELSGPGLGAAAAEGAWPRGGAGTAGPGELRRSLPAAGSMARAADPGGGDERSADSTQKCEASRLAAGGGTDGRRAEGGRAPRGGGAPAAEGAGVRRSRETRAAGGRGWGRVAAAALRPRGQVRAAGTRPEAPRPVGKEGIGRARGSEARRPAGGSGRAW